MVPAETGPARDGEIRRAEERRRFRLTKAQKIRSSGDFAEIYAGQQRVGDGFLLILGRRNELGITRLGLSVSRKHGNAVRRARLKRLLREAFRLSQHDLPTGLDLILIPRQNIDTTVDDFRQSLVGLARRLSKRLNREAGR